MQYLLTLITLNSDKEIVKVLLIMIQTDFLVLKVSPMRSDKISERRSRKTEICLKFI